MVNLHVFKLPFGEKQMFVVVSKHSYAKSKSFKVRSFDLGASTTSYRVGL